MFSLVQTRSNKFRKVNFGSNKSYRSSIHNYIEFKEVIFRANFKYVQISECQLKTTHRVVVYLI